MRRVFLVCLKYFLLADGGCKQLQLYHCDRRTETLRMDISLSMFILLISATLVLGQRPFFAGTKPIGYPETPNITDSLGDRFGEVDGTTPRLPVEAHGDLAFIDRLSKLPVDKQPFWFINWQAYEAHRQNPQTYPQRPSSFNDPIPTTNNANSGAVNSNSVPISNSDTNANRFGEPDSNVKPVVASTNNDKNVESKPDSEPKPVATVNNDKKKRVLKRNLLYPIPIQQILIMIHPLPNLIQLLPNLIQLLPNLIHPIPNQSQKRK
ncbi:uncharacterized protein LOC119191266 isoform X2 [Manduca sexta]|uniref:uncharacterized protein LOC119191266 isoform X2 n=1 Tax=Manduca sexta TaxID=7130 RepID=UPI001890699F|nr:uncharacterized protein LOC119191266 isoform X2 [Manduca sexta]